VDSTPAPSPLHIKPGVPGSGTAFLSETVGDNDDVTFGLFARFCFPAPSIFPVDTPWINVAVTTLGVDGAYLLTFSFQSNPLTTSRTGTLSVAGTAYEVTQLACEDDPITRPGCNPTFSIGLTTFTVNAGDGFPPDNLPSFVGGRLGSMGFTPGSCSVIAGQLPPGITLDLLPIFPIPGFLPGWVTDVCRLSGTFQSPGMFTFTVQITDAGGRVVSQEFNTR